jgi:crossover junction endodeoxyribonuclease RuvC
MWILGIDPGTRTMGWGMVHVDRGTERLGPFGHISTKDQDISKRLGYIYTQLSAIMQDHKPAVMALETVFVNINPQSALTLGYARGLALATAGIHGIPVAEYAPNTIKKSLTGNGHATKDHMVSMVARLFSVSVPPDTADAISVGLCHARHMIFTRALSLAHK